MKGMIITAATMTIRTEGTVTTTGITTGTEGGPISSVSGIGSNSGTVAT